MRKRLFALIDANNFYVSCQRLFDASLQKTPIIVLSSNDGCVVARSQEVKKLGVKMGQPVFELQELIKTHNIRLFSSNYSLYADVSARIMTVLERFSPALEVFSIDEAFLDLTDLPIEDLREFGHTIRDQVLQLTGIPVSVGIGPSKTLAKAATEIVKHNPTYKGVLELASLPDDAVDAYLAQVSIEDVWGIGSKYARFLRSSGILSAKDLKYTDVQWIKRYLTVVGARTVLELRGIACIPFEAEPKPKKGIARANSFGRDVESQDELEEVLANYIARAAEKLRSQYTAFPYCFSHRVYRNQPV